MKMKAKESVTAAHAPTDLDVGDEVRIFYGVLPSRVTRERGPFEFARVVKVSTKRVTFEAEGERFSLVSLPGGWWHDPKGLNDDASIAIRELKARSKQRRMTNEEAC